MEGVIADEEEEHDQVPAISVSHYCFVRNMIIVDVHGLNLLLSLADRFIILFRSCCIVLGVRLRLFRQSLCIVLLLMYYKRFFL